jgi:carbonyl reductase 1
VLINNAGVNLDSKFSLENATKTIETNYRGTLEMSREALKMMKKSENGKPRIVSLSSVGSNLKTWKPDLAAQIREIDSLNDLEKMTQSYLHHVSNSTDISTGFPSERSYGVSKSAINVFTKILAKENPDVLINCCCPGWIDTGMGDLVSTRKVRPPKTPEQGAVIPVKLAVGEIGGVSGAYWANESVRSKEDGKVMEWW